MCATVVIAAVSPLARDVAASANTLKYAAPLRVAAKRAAAPLQADPRDPANWTHAQAKDWLAMAARDPTVDTASLARHSRQGPYGRYRLSVRGSPWPPGTLRVCVVGAQRLCRALVVRDTGRGGAREHLRSVRECASVWQGGGGVKPPLRGRAAVASGGEPECGDEGPAHSDGEGATGASTRTRQRASSRFRFTARLLYGQGWPIRRLEKKTRVSYDVLYKYTTYCTSI
eukprot:1120266-Prorocentrum_minimum.AAC.1